MLDFRKQFQEIIEQSYIPFNIDKTATSDVWSNIYKLVLPNIPEKLFRYRRIDDKGYTIESFKSKTISLCHAGMFPEDSLELSVILLGNGILGSEPDALFDVKCILEASMCK